jgi:hypothetical protein
MQAHTQTRTHFVEPRGATRAIDPWTLMTGASARIVAGFAADLLRLGLHSARGWFAAPRTPGRSGAVHWHCPRNCG